MGDLDRSKRTRWVSSLDRRVDRLYDGYRVRRRVRVDGDPGQAQWHRALLRRKQEEYRHENIR